MIKRFVVCFFAISILTACATTHNDRDTKAVIANVDPFELGSFEASFSDFTGFMISKGTMTVDFAPRENRIILNLKNQGNMTHIYLDESARSAINASMNRYYDDFESRSLRREGKANDAYGKISAYMEWGLLMINAKGTAEIRMGYKFVDKSPYFTLTIPETANEIYEKAGGSRVRQSGFLQIFFTRSQATEFAKTLEQENLLAALREQRENMPLANQDNVDTPDAYNDAEGDNGDYVEADAKPAAEGDRDSY